MLSDNLHLLYTLVVVFTVPLYCPDLELPTAGDVKKNRSSSKSEPDTPTPTLPLTTPDYAAGLGVEYPPATPSTSGGPGGSEISGPSGSTGKKGALELALQSPGPSSLATDTQRPQVQLSGTWLTATCLKSLCYQRVTLVHAKGGPPG